MKNFKFRFFFAGFGQNPDKIGFETHRFLVHANSTDLTLFFHEHHIELKIVNCAQLTIM